MEQPLQSAIAAWCREGKMSKRNEQISSNRTANARLIPCLWMEAGVVDYKLCDRGLDCEHCPFDEAVQSRSAKLILAGDLFGEDSDQKNNVNGCELASDLFYHSGHTWARVEEQAVVRTGLDDFGQRMLGRAYSVSLSAGPTGVKQGHECWRLTHQCGAATIAAPVSGQIKETNSNLAERPELLNHDPYGEGWVMLIEPSDLKAALKQLMYGERAREWLQREVERLRTIINASTNCEPATMADGGLLTKEFISELTVAQRLQVIESFFPTSLSGDAERNHTIKFPKRR